MGRKKALEEKEKLVSAAIRLIDDHGIRKFSMRQLASSLGISPMTLYHYYENRKELLLDITIECLDYLTNTIVNTISSDPRCQESPLYEHMIWAHHMMDFATHKPNLYLFLFGITEPDIMRNQRISPYLTYLGDRLHEHITDPAAAEQGKTDVMLFQVLINGLILVNLRSGRQVHGAEFSRLAGEAYKRLIGPMEALVTSTVARSN